MILVACKDRESPKARPVAVVPSAVTVASVDAAAPRASASWPLPPSDAGASLAARLDGDGGAPTSCRLIYGPAQEPFTGPATLVASARGMEIVQHRNGIAVVRVLAVTPTATAKTVSGRVPATDPVEKASKPPCAIAGKYAFCSDVQGHVHKSLREMASDEIVGKAVPGARLAAASLGGDRTVVGYVEKRRTEAGEMFEAWAKSDGDPPVRISEDGSGASDVVFAVGKPGEVFAWMIDARTAMTPIHKRVLRYTNKLELGPDAVVHVAGGTSRFLQGALATNEQGVVIGLLAASSDRGFGLLAVPLDVTTKEDAPFAFSPYPNGLDGAPLSATSNGRTLLVARVRPSRAPGEPPVMVGDASAPLPDKVLEIGRMDVKGVFWPLGIVATQGNVSSVATELDAQGALWLHYTDATGSWIERRVCAAG